MPETLSPYLEPRGTGVEFMKTRREVERLAGEIERVTASLAAYAAEMRDAAQVADALVRRGKPADRAVTVETETGTHEVYFPASLAAAMEARVRTLSVTAETLRAQRDQLLEVLALLSERGNATIIQA